MEPKDRRSEGVIEYQDRSTPTEQKEICLDYLEQKNLMADFEAWWDELSVKGAWLDDVVAYCEERVDFWDWLE
jgi:hypothetical protein